MALNPLLLTVVADLFINLAAGWFGIILVVSRPTRTPPWLIATNLAGGIISLYLAYQLRILAASL